MPPSSHLGFINFLAWMFQEDLEQYFVHLGCVLSHSFKSNGILVLPCSIQKGNVFDALLIKLQAPCSMRITAPAGFCKLDATQFHVAHHQFYNDKPKLS